MKPATRQLALAGLMLLAAGAASAGVTVTYNEPDKFSDLPFSPWEREDALETLDGHFVKLGKGLPAGQELKVEVLDVDLAGREYPGARTGRDIRVLKGQADWPVIRLRYSLEANGQVIKSGEEQLSDMNYLHRVNRYFDGESLRYEKQIIDDWFNKTIVQKGKG